MVPVRFVILHHTGFGRDHYDLMIEQSENLATWQLYHDLRELPQDSVEAIRLGDHRKFYLDYEGLVSGGRGDVRRVSSGTCEILHWSPQKCSVRLISESFNGFFELVLSHSDHWMLVRASGNSDPRGRV